MEPERRWRFSVAITTNVMYADDASTTTVIAHDVPPTILQAADSNRERNLRNTAV